MSASASVESTLEMEEESGSPKVKASSQKEASQTSLDDFFTVRRGKKRSSPGTKKRTGGENTANDSPKSGGKTSEEDEREYWRKRKLQKMKARAGSVDSDDTVPDEDLGDSISSLGRSRQRGMKRSATELVSSTKSLASSTGSVVSLDYGSHEDGEEVGEGETVEGEEDSDDSDNRFLAWFRARRHFRRNRTAPNLRDSMYDDLEEDGESSEEEEEVIKPERGENDPDRSASKLFRKITLENGLTLEIRKGDLTAEDVGAIVNAANSHLSHGAGVAGAISRNGGWSIQKASSRLVRERGRIPNGEVVRTTSGRLKCSHCFHAVGPIWHDGRSGEVKELADCVTNSLRLASSLGVRAVAIPAISSDHRFPGIFGFPKRLCARVMIRCAMQFDPNAPVPETPEEGATTEETRTDENGEADTGKQSAEKGKGTTSAEDERGNSKKGSENGASESAKTTETDTKKQPVRVLRLTNFDGHTVRLFCDEFDRLFGGGEGDKGVQEGGGKDVTRKGCAGESARDGEGRDSTGEENNSGSDSDTTIDMKASTASVVELSD